MVKVVKRKKNKDSASKKLKEDSSKEKIEPIKTAETTTEQQPQASTTENSAMKQLSSNTRKQKQVFFTKEVFETTQTEGIDQAMKKEKFVRSKEDSC